MGDLIVTDISEHSHNNRCGYPIGYGYNPSDAVKQVGVVVEGINVLPAAMKLSELYEVETSIISAVDHIINYNKTAKDIAMKLMGRDSTTELSKSVLDINFESVVIKNTAIRAQGD